MDFVIRGGYMPVTQAAFDNYLPQAIEALDSPKYAALYQAFLETQADYEFYVPPQVETYLELETCLEDQVRAQLAQGRREYLDAAEPGSELLERISQERYSTFRQILGE